MLAGGDPEVSAGDSCWWAWDLPAGLRQVRGNALLVHRVLGAGQAPPPPHPVPGTVVGGRRPEPSRGPLRTGRLQSPATVDGAGLAPA